MDYAKIIRERRPKLRDNSVIAYALSLKSIAPPYNKDIEGGGRQGCRPDRAGPSASAPGPLRRIRACLLGKATPTKPRIPLVCSITAPNLVT